MANSARIFPRNEMRNFIDDMRYTLDLLHVCAAKYLRNARDMRASKITVLTRAHRDKFAF